MRSPPEYFECVSRAKSPTRTKQCETGDLSFSHGVCEHENRGSNKTRYRQGKREQMMAGPSSNSAGRKLDPAKDS